MRKVTSSRHPYIFLIPLLLSAGCIGTSEASSRAGDVVAREATGLDGAPLGNLGLDVACTEGAREHVLRGLALLHHMTYEESARSFEAATREDPECAVGYWGVAMSYVHPLWPDMVNDERLAAGEALLAQAREAATRTDVEDGFIRALEAYYEGAQGSSEPERLARFAEGWQRAHEAHPADPETAAFYALSILATAPPDKEYAAQIRAGEVVAGVLEVIPNHPGAHHYTIHAFDFPPLADRALEAARSYGGVAPNNPHALHMTSHIFTRLGLWVESIEFNSRSADAAWEHPVAGAISHHHLHALDYLAYAHLQVGNDAAADSVEAHVHGLDGPLYDHAATAYAVAAVPARVVLERRDWEGAANLPTVLTPAVPWDKYPYLEALPVFAHTLGSARTGDVAAAERGLERLADLTQQSAQTAGAYDWGTQVEVLRLAANAWIEAARGNDADALRLAQAAADLEDSTDKNPVTPGSLLPARELYGDMLMEQGRLGEAVEAYRQSLEISPNRFWSLYSAARAAEDGDNAAQARDMYTRLIELAGDSDRAEVARARQYVSGA